MRLTDLHLTVCQACYATVQFGDIERHSDWHALLGQVTGMYWHGDGETLTTLYQDETSEEPEADKVESVSDETKETV